MSNEFEPMFTETPTEFTQWEYTQEDITQPEVDQAELLNTELENLKEQARQQGYQEGLSQAKEEIIHTSQVLGEWLHLLHKPIQIMDDALTQEVVESIIWICKTCIEIELSVHPEKIKAVFEAALAQMPALKGSKTMTMNPDDLTWLSTHLPKEQWTEIKEFLKADEALNHGDFKLNSDETELDGCVEHRLNTIFEQYIKPTDFDQKNESESSA